MTNIVSSVVAKIAEPINFTTVIAFITVSLAAMGTLIKIFSSKGVTDESLRESPYIKEISDSNKELAKKQADLECRINNEIGELDKELNRSVSELCDSTHALMIEVERLKIESLNSERSLEELKIDYRELGKRLDVLIKDLMNWVCKTN